MWRKVNRREQARMQRKQATPAERHAWGLLRGRRLLGLKFRRQHPIGEFVVDFACLEHRLVLELDGAHHRSPQQRAYDAHRDALIGGAGFTVVRVSNRDVTLARLECVVHEALPATALRAPDDTA